MLFDIHLCSALYVVICSLFNYSNTTYLYTIYINAQSYALCCATARRFCVLQLSWPFVCSSGKLHNLVYIHVVNVMSF